MNVLIEMFVLENSGVLGGAKVVSRVEGEFVVFFCLYCYVRVVQFIIPDAGLFSFV